MTRYIIAHEFIAQLSNDDPFIEALKQISARQVQATVWIVMSNDTVDELASYLLKFVEIETIKNRLLVYPVVGAGREFNSEIREIRGQHT